MQNFLLGYLFLSFVIGIACLGIAVWLAVRRRDAVSRSFLAFYSALSIVVTATLLLAFADAAPGVFSASTRHVIQYLESIVGFYGVMLTLPLFIHRVVRIEDPRCEWILVFAVLITLVLQHLTEFVLGSTPWDQRGDWLENGVFLVILAYVCWVAYAHFGAANAKRHFDPRLMVLPGIGIAAIFCDVFFTEDWGVRFYPLGYSITSVFVTWILVRSEPGAQTAPTLMTDGWGLSEREGEVADGVAHGLSNKEIAAVLHISPNTVKTHMRAIFEKAGVRSRLELISRMSGFSRPNHPKG